MELVRTGREWEAAGELACLLRGCRRGDAAAWEQVLEQVRRLALTIGRQSYRLNADDAEDLAQVAQLRVAQRFPQLHDLAAFPAWVRQLTHRAALDQLRRNRPQDSLEETLACGVDPAQPDGEVSYERIELRMDLERALSRLPEKHREPIRLFLLEGMAQEEIGRILGRPRNTVASQIDRGLDRLKQCFTLLR